MLQLRARRNAPSSDMIQQIIAGDGTGHGAESQEDADEGEVEETLDGDGRRCPITSQESRDLSPVGTIVMVSFAQLRLVRGIVFDGNI